MPYSSHTEVAPLVTFGAFVLEESQKAKINTKKHLKLTDEEIEGIS